MNTEKTESTELVQVLQESQLPVEKKNVVKELLLPFFTKVDEWRTQVDSIVITDPSQTDKMALAKTGRLQLKNFRLEAEKLIKAQREIIKAKMADDVLEDKLWLHSGKIMEAEFKNLETKLEEKEKFAERHKAEMEEKTRAERAGLLAEYGQVEIPGLGQMSQEQFDMYLSGVKTKFEADQKAEQERQEAERVQNLHNERYARLAKYADFIPDFENLNFGKISEEDFIKVGTDAKAKKDKADAEQARIQAENERLKKEKENAEECTRIRSKELHPYIIFIRNYSELIRLDEAEYQRQFAEIKQGAEEHWEYERQEKLRIQKEHDDAEKARKEASLRFLLDNGFEQTEGGVKYKSDSFNWFIGSNIYSLLSSDKEYEEFKKSVLNQIDLINLDAEKQKAIDEANRLKEAEQARIDAQNKIEADQKAEAERIAKQGENERLLAWIESFELPEIPGGGYTTSGRATMGAVQQKFESFKAWAKTQVVSK